MAGIFYTPTTNLTFDKVQPLSMRIEKGVSDVEFSIPSRTLCQLRFDLGYKDEEQFLIRDIRVGSNEIKLDLRKLAANSHIKILRRTENELLVRSCGADPYLVYKGDLSGCVSEGRSLVQVALLPLWFFVLFLLGIVVCRILSGWFCAVRLWLKNGSLREAEERSHSLDILRIMAFLMVVFAHLCFWSNPKFMPEALSLKNIAWGGYGVRIFFFLSGASMTFGTFKRMEEHGSFSFYVGRLRAILPSYWVATFVVGAFWFVLHGTSYWNGDPWDMLVTFWGLNEYLHMRCILSGTWFVGSMLLLYLCVPAIYYCLKRWPLFTMLVSLGISYLSLEYSDSLTIFAPWWNCRPHFNTFSHLFEFVAGALFLQRIRKNRFAYMYFTLLSVALLSVYFAFPHKMVFDHRNIVGVSASMLPVFMGIFIFDFLRLNKEVQGLVAFFARNSYLAYLYHFFIIKQFVTRNAMINESLFWYEFVFVIASSYILAYVSGSAVNTIKALFPRVMSVKN